MKLLNNINARFVIIFIGSYFLLTGLLSISVVSESANALLRGISKSFLQGTFSELKLNTKAEKANGVLDDNKMIVEFEWTQKKIDQVIERARRTGQTDIQVPYRFISYLLCEFFMVPLIFLWSLTLATPMNRKGKWIQGGYAFLCLLGFLLLKLYLMTLFSVSKAKIDVYELDHAMMSTLQWLASMMTMGFSVILAFFLWLVWVFPKSELKERVSYWLENSSIG